MRIYPEIYIKSVKDITLDMLENRGIKGLLLDVDNTLIDYYKEMPDGITEWFEKIKGAGIKCCILSNSNKVEKVSKVANTVGIPYIYFAKKPLKSGFKAGSKKLNLIPEEIAVVGDQMFTDVLGANRSGMCSILVEPIDKKDLLFTAIKRPIEGVLLKRYLKKKSNKLKKKES